MKVLSITNPFGYEIYLKYEGEYVPLRCYNHGYAKVKGSKVPWWNVYLEEESGNLRNQD